MRYISRPLVFVAAILAAVVASPVATDAFPSFSLTPGSPTAPIVGGGGVILDPATGAPVIGGQPAPVVGIPPGNFGIPPGGNITGISYGNDQPLFGPPVGYQFSVGPGSPGGVWLGIGPPDNVATQFAEGANTADIFTGTVGLPPGALICAPGAAANALVYDADGVSAAFGLVPGLGGLVDPPAPPVGPPYDDIDAYDASDFGAVDYYTALTPLPPFVFAPDTRLDAPVYFTVDAATAAGMPLDPFTLTPITPGDVLVTDPSSPTGYIKYATAAVLGLAAGDVIDALIVGDSIMTAAGPGGAIAPARTFGHPMDFVGYSLAPGSPSLGLLPPPCLRPSSPSDVWAVSPFLGGLVPWIAAESLGLCAIPVCAFNDNLDALDVAWGPGGDLDVDGLPDLMEGGACPGAVAGVTDTDADGLQDGLEAAMGFLPGMICTAGGNFPQPGLADSDADGMLDGWEIRSWRVFCPATNPSAVDALGDIDAEGAPNILEHLQGTEPCIADSDGDVFTDAPQSLHLGPANTVPARDNCPNVFNPTQVNADGNFTDLSPPKAFDDLTLPRSDAMGDACDTDDDNDGLSDADEGSGAACAGFLTSSLIPDSDGDHFIDGAECSIGTNPTDITLKPALAACGAAGDADGDGILTQREFCFFGTSPAVANSDGDACADGREVASINGDTAVNVIDLSQVAAEVGVYVLPGTPVQRDYDMTKDGAINVIDLSFVAGRSGLCP